MKTPKEHPGYKMERINHGESDEWLSRCLTKEEDKEGKKIILLMKEVVDGRHCQRAWYKVVIEDLNYKGESRCGAGRYILRGFTTGPISDDYKKLTDSCDDNYRIDHATIAVGCSFWFELNNILK